MKPTLPEDDELEKMSSDVSGRYRAGVQDEPPARLDAVIQAAAHREVEQPRRRNWRVPASIAAMLVIGVSLVLIVRDNEPPLPSLANPAADEAKLAKSAPPQLAMKAQPRARPDFRREDMPSRERNARPDREPAARDEAATAAASGTAAQSVPAPAAPAKPAEQELGRIAESADMSPGKKAKGLADAAGESRQEVPVLRKQEAAAPVQPREWLDEIDGLVRGGKEAEARLRLLEFRRQYPVYPLPERLQGLLPAEAPK